MDAKRVTTLTGPSVAKLAQPASDHIVVSVTDQPDQAGIHRMGVLEQQRTTAPVHRLPDANRNGRRVPTTIEELEQATRLLSNISLENL